MDPQYKPFVTQDNTAIDLTGKTFLALEDCRWPDDQPAPERWPTQSEMQAIDDCVTAECYPVSIKGTASNVTIKGGKVRGRLHPLAPWHVWKDHADGDGCRVELPGACEIQGMHIDNVSDGISPRGQGSSFGIYGCYLNRIHDDGLENDDVLSGVVNDCLFRCHTFYSARGKRNPGAVVDVYHSLIELLLQPHQGGSNGPTDINEQGGYPYRDGLGCGSLLKMEWRRDISGRIHFQDCMFLIPRHGTSSNESMTLTWEVGGIPQVTYDNCTLVWLGWGAYPHPMPPGLMITSDRSVFDRAKAAWFDRHPQFSETPTPVPVPPSDPCAALRAELIAAQERALVAERVITEAAERQQRMIQKAQDCLWHVQQVIDIGKG